MPGEGEELLDEIEDIPDILLLGRLNALIQLSVLSRRSADNDEEANEASVGDLARCVSGLLRMPPWGPL